VDLDVASKLKLTMLVVVECDTGHDVARLRCDETPPSGGGVNPEDGRIYEIDEHDEWDYLEWKGYVW
jgi:hypothetical protein